MGIAPYRFSVNLHSGAEAFIDCRSKDLNGSVDAVYGCVDAQRIMARKSPRLSGEAAAIVFSECVFPTQTQQSLPLGFLLLAYALGAESFIGGYKDMETVGSAAQHIASETPDDHAASRGGIFFDDLALREEYGVLLRDCLRCGIAVLEEPIKERTGKALFHLLHGFRRNAGLLSSMSDKRIIVKCDPKLFRDALSDFVAAAAELPLNGDNKRRLFRGRCCRRCTRRKDAVDREQFLIIYLNKQPDQNGSENRAFPNALQ